MIFSNPQEKKEGVKTCTTCGGINSEDCKDCDGSGEMPMTEEDFEEQALDRMLNAADDKMDRQNDNY